MNPLPIRSVALLLAAVAIGLGSWVLFSRSSPDPAPSPAVAGPHASPSPSPAPPSSRPGRPPRPAPAPAGQPSETPAILAAIEEASLTYEPAAVRTIVPFLTHADPAVREAALDALTNLGEPDAIPFLRKAAGELADAEEAASYHKIADYLALPSWSDSEQGRQAADPLRRPPPDNPPSPDSP